MIDSGQQRMNPPRRERVTEPIQNIRDDGFISLKKIRSSTLKCSFQ